MLFSQTCLIPTKLENFLTATNKMDTPQLLYPFQSSRLI